MNRICSHIHTFSTRHYELAVWATTEPGVFRCFIRGTPGQAVSVYRGVMECAVEQLRELESLTKLAQLLIGRLKEGKPFEKWTDDDPSLN